MKLSELQVKLAEIQQYYGDDIEVNIMTEENIEKYANSTIVQFNRKVTDIAVSRKSGIIIIGQEIE